MFKKKITKKRVLILIRVATAHYMVGKSSLNGLASGQGAGFRSSRCPATGGVLKCDALA